MALSIEHHGVELVRDIIARHRIILPGSRWAFLGNQRVRGTFLHRKSVTLLSLLGAEVVMWDSNGKDGAIKHDLNEPVGIQWNGWADVMANLGTSEHVTPGQKQVFATMHDVCKIGGAMLHTVPMVGGCDHHGWWKYTVSWFKSLAEANGYDILLLDTRSVEHNRGAGPHNYVVATFRKMSHDALNDAAWFDPYRG